MLLVIDRYRVQRRQLFQRIVEAGKVHLREEFALLMEGSQLQKLARFSLYLLLLGFLIFIPLTLLSHYLWYGTWLGDVSFLGALLWVVVNLVSYVGILLVHEAIHGLAILFWGGRPHFGVSYLDGTRVPLALYCGAREQLFPRNYYLVIALAPLIVITGLAVVLTILLPSLASYVLLATIGNLSGAAGDLQVVQRILRFPPQTLIEDTETGYRAWDFVLDANEN